MVSDASKMVQEKISERRCAHTESPYLQSRTNSVIPSKEITGCRHSCNCARPSSSLLSEHNQHRPRGSWTSRRVRKRIATMRLRKRPGSSRLKRKYWYCTHEEGRTDARDDQPARRPASLVFAEQRRSRGCRGAAAVRGAARGRASEELRYTIRTIYVSMVDFF